jgi:sulfatase modifying factor 1
MGAEDGLADEKPQHRLVLPAFLIDRLPVTNAAFAEFFNANGWRSAAGRRY